MRPIAYSRPAPTRQLLPLTLKITGKRKIQAFVGDQRRRLRHRVGALQHGERGFVEGGVAGSLDDGAETTWPMRSSAKETMISALFCERSAG